MEQSLYGIPIRLPEEERVAGCCCRMPGAARIVAIAESVLISFAVVWIIFVFVTAAPAAIVDGTLVDLICVICLFKAVRLRSPSNTLPYIIWKSIQTFLVILRFAYSVYAVAQLRHIHQDNSGDNNEDGYFGIKPNAEPTSTRTPFVVPMELTLKAGLFLGLSAAYIVLQIVFIHIVVQVRHYLLRQPNPPVMYPSRAINNEGGYSNVVEEDEPNQDLVKFQVATYEFQAPPPAYELEFRKQ